MRSKKYKKFIQMVTYAPYFISTVVMVGMMMRMMDMRTGIINRALQSIGIGPINFFGEVNLFRHFMYGVVSGRVLVILLLFI